MDITGWILLSWLPNLDPDHPVIQFIYRVTEPVLAPFRNMIPPLNGFDLSPIIVFFILGMVRRLLISMIRFVFW